MRVRTLVPMGRSRSGTTANGAVLRSKARSGTVGSESDRDVVACCLGSLTKRRSEVYVGDVGATSSLPRRRSKSGVGMDVQSKGSACGGDEGGGGVGADGGTWSLAGVAADEV